MSFTVTTWNVENFSSNSESFSEKLSFLTGVIQLLGSDVVALQEILDQSALDALAGELGYHAIAAAPDSRGIRVAFLLKNGQPSVSAEITDWILPPNVTVRSMKGPDEAEVVPSIPRPALRVDVTHAGQSISLITAHLKSKLLTFPGGNFSTSNESLRSAVAYCALERRAAEARTIREHVNVLLASGRAVIVLGDLNDGPDAATTQILYGPTGGQPMDIIHARKSAGAFQRADNEDERRLFNVATLVPTGIAWSRKHHGREELIDHILASHDTMPRVNNLRVIPDIRIDNDVAENIGDHPRDDVVVPDHAPVTATFHF